MIQVQMRIHWQNGRHELLVDVLEREDASDQERKLARSVEDLHRKIFRFLSGKNPLWETRFFGREGDPVDERDVPTIVCYCRSCDERRDCVIRVTDLEGSKPEYVTQGIDVTAEAICPKCGKVAAQFKGFLDD